MATVPLDDLFQPDSTLTPLPGMDLRLLLNGKWRATRDAKASEVEVPGELAMQGIVAPAGWIDMERTFAAPISWRAMRVKIRFDAVYSACRVWMNGVFVGRHLGGFTPFEVDVTGALRLG